MLERNLGKGEEVVPFPQARSSSRRRWLQCLPAEVVRWLQALSTARERLDLLSEALRSFLEARSKASTVGGGFDLSGWSESCSKRRSVFSALGIKRRVPATCWRVREHFWRVELGRGGLERKIGIGLAFWQSQS